MRIASCVIALCLFGVCAAWPVTGHAQEEENVDWSTGTPWAPDTKLQPKDFQQPPPDGGNLDAESDVKVNPGSVTCNFDTGEMTYTPPVAYFFKSNSYVRPAATNDPQLKAASDASLLSHESRHFDIGQIYALKMMIVWEQFKGEAGCLCAQKNKAAWDAAMKKAMVKINQLLKNHKSVQNRYDDDTAHSGKPVPQAAYDASIPKQLAQEQKTLDQERAKQPKAACPPPENRTAAPPPAPPPAAPPPATVPAVPVVPAIPVVCPKCSEISKHITEVDAELAKVKERRNNVWLYQPDTQLTRAYIRVLDEQISDLQTKRAKLVAAKAECESKCAYVPTAQTGTYVALQTGKRWTNTKWDAQDQVTLGVVDPVVNPLTSIPTDPLRVKLVAGYDQSIAPGWIAGAVLDIGFGKNSGSEPRIPGSWGTGGIATPKAALNDSIHVSQSWDVSLRGRLGSEVWPGVLLYGTAGVDLLHMSASINCTLAGACGAVGTPVSANRSAVKAGWVAGGGLEFSLAGFGLGPNWRGQLEYLHADLGTWTPGLGNPATFLTKASLSTTTDTVMVGLVYRFGGSP